MSDTTATTQTQSWMSFARKNLREQSLVEIRNGFAQAPHYALGNIIEDLRRTPEGAPMLEVLMSLTVTELRDLLTPPAADKPAKEKKVSTDVKIENWSDAAVKAAHAERVMAFLTAKGLGEGDFARGFTPVELRKEQSVLGSEDQLRETMQTLEAAGKVAFTGDTKGKRYVVASLRVEADKAFAAYKAAKAEAEAKKAANKEAGTAPKGGRKAKAAPSA